MSFSTNRVAAAAAILLFGTTAQSFAQDVPAEARAGEAEFANSCASCHGSDAQGAGFLTRLFRGVDPGDLTMIAANNGGTFPSDRVYEVIDGRADVAAHGDRKMPVWGDRYWETAMSQYGPDAFNEERAKNRLRELVTYLQAIQQ